MESSEQTFNRILYLFSGCMTLFLDTIHKETESSSLFPDCVDNALPTGTRSVSSYLSLKWPDMIEYSQETKCVHILCTFQSTTSRIVNVSLILNHVSAWNSMFNHKVDTMDSFCFLSPQQLGSNSQICSILRTITVHVGSESLNVLIRLIARA